MDPSDVSDVLFVLATAELDVCVDGGWGVDALLERQTRVHSDLDLVVDHILLERAASTLAAVGYQHDVTATPGVPSRLALLDGRGSHVDFHPIVTDEQGNGWQPLGERAWGLYTADGLMGHGRIGERQVRCITAELQLRHHLGYAWSDVDRHDMGLLAERFGIPLPPPHHAGGPDEVDDRRGPGGQ